MNKDSNWKWTKDEKPDSTRHLIFANGGLISHYGYYVIKEDKWYTNWKCEEEIPAPVTVDKTQSEERVLPPIVVAIPSKIEEEAEEEEKVESSDEIEITPVENEDVKIKK